MLRRFCPQVSGVVLARAVTATSLPLGRAAGNRFVSTGEEPPTPRKRTVAGPWGPREAAATMPPAETKERASRKRAENVEQQPSGRQHYHPTGKPPGEGAAEGELVSETTTKTTVGNIGTEEIQQEEAPPSLQTIEEAALAALHHSRHVNAKEAVVLDESQTKKDVSQKEDGKGKNVIPKKKVRFVSPQESMAIEFQKMAHALSQEGPYIGSKQKDHETSAVELRRRREIERVTPFRAPWQGYETSFRRLPPGVKIPNEWELRGAYPMNTTMKIEWDYADFADLNALDPMEKPEPVKYGKLLPPNYDKTKKYPYMVALPDFRGLERDLEDMCANFFERGNVLSQMHEQEFVVFAPLVNQRHSIIYPIEGVVARFCDWVVDNHNVENGKVHLFGKGLGGNTAIRTCIEYKELAVSVTAILGRMSTPFRPMDRPMEKVKNLNGTHCLLIVPGGMRKLEYAYKFKMMCDIQQTEPPVRALHYADVRDQQIYYALNPYEVWSHLKFFRQPDSIQPSTQRSWDNEEYDELRQATEETEAVKEKIQKLSEEEYKDMPTPPGADDSRDGVAAAQNPYA